MKVYSQRDPKWAGRTLGATKLTVGRFGCIVTAVAMLSSAFGPDHDPGEILRHLRFTPEGLLYWASFKFETLKFESRKFERDDEKITDYIKDPRKAVILQVAAKSHWVVGTSVLDCSSYFGIADPWDGVQKSIREYNNDINGVAYFGPK